MSSVRPKRKVSQKAAVIEISDSEDEVSVVRAKRKFQKDPSYEEIIEGSEGKSKRPYKRKIAESSYGSTKARISKKPRKHSPLSAAKQDENNKISDSEDDMNIVPPKRKIKKNSSHEETIQGSDRKKTRQLAKPSKGSTKERISKKTSTKSPFRAIKQDENNKSNDDSVISIKEEINKDNVDGQLASKSKQQVTADQNHNIPTPSKIPTGRSSFYARRKIWHIHELLAETENIDLDAAYNIVNLLDNENTIPFICRYRRDLVNHISPEQLRDIKNSYTEIVNLRKKAETIVTQLEKENINDEEVRTEMLCAKSNEELEFLYAPYKPASKGSLAERAKALGLEVYANRLLYGDTPPVQIESIIDYKNPDLDTTEKVINGICNIISHNISKHTGVLEELRRLRKLHRIYLKSTKSKSAKPTKENSTSVNKHPKTPSKNDEFKYEVYFDFQNDVTNLKPHQILAINRGEKSKFLTIKLIISDYFKKDIKGYLSSIFLNEGTQYPLRREVFEKVFEECYSKKLQPLTVRQIRADLNESAKKASIDVFAKNLKQLLLMSPLKGERILGIDPGFTNGCKLAVISETTDVLETGVIYPHSRHTDPEQCGEQLARLLKKYNCKIIALGNGTACRETEFWLSKLFEMHILDGSTIRYSIVSEQGASIYSCSEIAKKEFPTMDLNEISAVSIARRLNDPLSEYVKIDPRHIGVGMYQHDINEKVLTESLNEIVSECVSYVGVDINTASLSVLKHVAGLTEKKAEKIIDYRAEKGVFRTRKDLLQVKSIGEKTFVQCAGFIRIEPRSVGGKIDNLLDCTWVHPESYAIAKKIITKCKLVLDNIGNEHFISTIKNYVKSSNIDELAKEFKIPKERLEIVFIALQRKLFQDYRSDFDKRPLFKQGITRLTDLSECDIVTGAVTNITHFGAFVDIGVECDGLIHISKMNNVNLNIGDRVTCSIVQVDVKRKRVGLRLEDMKMETDTSFTIRCS